MKNKFAKKADELRNECLDELDIMSPLCVGSKCYDTYGFAIEDKCSRWYELIWFQGGWQLVEYGTDNYAPARSIPVDELCEIIDRIIEHPNYKRK